MVDHGRTWKHRVAQGSLYKTPPTQWQMVHWPLAFARVNLRIGVCTLAHRHSQSKRDTMVLRHRKTLTRQETGHSGKNQDQFERCQKAQIPCIWSCQIEPTFYQISFCNSVFEEPIYLEKVSIIFFCWWLRNASLCIYPRLSELPDNFDRIRLEFVGFKKVVFVVVRFLGSGEEVSNPLA